MDKQNVKAVVLLSGGQDSTTCLFWAKQRFEHVEAVGFNYGQKHVIELEQAAKIAGIAGVNYKVFDLRGVLGGSSLTDHNKSHNEQHQVNKDLPASFTAGRNALFLTVAASYAHGIGAKHIITGTCQTDYSGYPDCRREFIDSMELSLSLAMDNTFAIVTPLMFLTKAETWKLAKELSCLDIIINETITDYNGTLVQNEWGYGVEDNPATILRAKGFYEAKNNGWI